MAMVEVDMAVIKPLAFTVAVRVWLELPKVPMLLLTEVKVKAPELLMEASPLIVTKVGAEDVTPTNSWPLVPTVVVEIPEVPLPSSKALDVNVESPVPPLATESCPAKPGVKVWTPPVEVMVKVMLASVPVAKVWLAWLWPLREVMAPEAEAQFCQVSPEAVVEEATRHKPLAPTPKRMLLLPSDVNKSPLVVSGERLLKAVVVLEEPVPPLARGRTPLTSLLPKAMAPLNKAPPEVDLTGRAWFKVVTVVEPVTVSKLPPVKVRLEEVATTPVPLPNSMSLAVKVLAPVPPFGTGRTPVTLEARLIWLAVICWPLMVK